MPVDPSVLDAATFAAPMLLEVHAREPELSTAGPALLFLGDQIVLTPLSTPESI